jgi:GNAT superfamily N-acetyltransferase
VDEFGIQWGGLVAQVEMFGRTAPQARLIRHGNMIGSVLPTVPQSSIANAAICRDATAAPHELAAMADEFRQAGVQKWGLWTNGGSAEAEAQAGLTLDSTPAAMFHTLEDLEEVPPTGTPDLATVGRVNDLAYGFTEPRLAPALANLDSTVHTYGIGDHSVAMAYDHGHDDTVVGFVATRPEDRGRGLAGLVLKRLLLEAKQRGNRSASLQASAKGKGVYERLGFRTIGTLHLYEERFS